MAKKINIDTELLQALYVSEGLSIPQIANRLGVSHHVIHKKLKQAGIIIRSISEALKLAFRQGRINHTGEHSHNWKGGRRIVRGYVYLWKRGHPLADKRGYVKEHILVAEEKIGRALKQGEIVHHLNGIRSDNHPENLQVLPKDGERGHHGYLVMQSQQRRIRELEGILNAYPKF